jgi:cysteine synthase B
MSTAEDIAPDLPGRIGDTPLLRLDALARRAGGLPEGVTLWAKAEHRNPGGSVKDRAALAMILDGERSGALVSGKAILDATSGNTGIAYAMIGAARGWPVAVCLPSNAGEARKRLLRAWGATVLETDPLTGTDGAQQVARAMALAEPGRWFHPNQYDNPANWRAHAETTAPEIWRQTGGRVTHFLAGLGTTGTFVGTVRGLRHLAGASGLGVRAIAMQPDLPLHGIEGLKHLPTCRVPRIYDPTLADETVTVSTEDALAAQRALRDLEGLDVGVSSGANVHAALAVARSATPGSLVVTILCDRGDRYDEAEGNGAR